MEPKKVVHLMYIPWTGLGMYGGFRGNRWLRNRIAVFKQFVVPSLLAQTNQDFKIWMSWRYEEKWNPQVVELEHFLIDLFGWDRVISTYSGVCFWDDKYPDDQAYDRLVEALHGATGPLHDFVGDCNHVLMTIQPSDDCYNKDFVNFIQGLFETKPEIQAAGYTKGYITNYRTLEIHEYNPTTNPPFFTIKFERDDFLDPLAHMEYTGPYKSHEFVVEKLNYMPIDERGFLVGTHGENISTVFNHPFKGEECYAREILEKFGLEYADPIKIRLSFRKALLRKLPHKVQRKLRYVFGEKVYNRFYNWIRS